MTSSEPLLPLKWYEHLLLRFLAQSPRITSIYVIQPVPTPVPPRPPIPSSTVGQRNLRSHVNYLESLLQLPPPPEDDTNRLG
jgi:hypothetical protein